MTLGRARRILEKYVDVPSLCADIDAALSALAECEAGLLADIDAAVKGEREACARVAEETVCAAEPFGHCLCALDAAEAIRARGAS